MSLKDEIRKVSLVLKFHSLLTINFFLFIYKGAYKIIYGTRQFVFNL